MSEVDRITPPFCPLKGLPAVPRDLSETVSDLARRNISPDTFHIEERDLRWATLAACSPAQTSLFRDLQTDLSYQIGEMSTEKIAENLGRLFNKAYRDDSVSNTMVVADPQAKRKLDLWIAVIDHRAFQDKGFLDRVLGPQDASDQQACLPDVSSSIEISAHQKIQNILTVHSPNDRLGKEMRLYAESNSFDLFAPRETTSRLDRYQRRNRFLSRFRDFYREFLTTPLEERFSPKYAKYYSILRFAVAMAKIGGLLVTIKDLDEIRKEVQDEVGVRTSGPVTWKEFVNRDPRQPLFIRPAELGGLTLADGSCAEPLALSSRIKINGSLLSDLIRDNVDFIAILPPELMPSENRVALTYLLLGTIILNGAISTTVKGRPPSPGLFHGVLAHEAGHQVWDQTNFNDHPDFLMRRATHELYAYLIESLAQESYRNTGCALPAEQDWLQGEEVYVDSIMRWLGRTECDT